MNMRRDDGGRGSRSAIRPVSRFLANPWGVAAATCLFAGAVLLVVAWYQISGTANVWEQMPYLVSAAFTGLALIIVGSAMLVAGRHHSLERRVAQLVDALTEAVTPEPAAPGPSGSPEGAEDELLATAGGKTYHRASCLLLQDKPTHTVTAAGIEGRDGNPPLTPCPVCDPPALAA